MEISGTTLSGLTINQAPQSILFTYTGGTQTWVVPPGVTQVRVTAAGGGGGGIQGGKGAIISSIVPVTPLTTLYIFVGGGGVMVPPYKFGGGGLGGQQGNIARNGGAGGGFSGVFTSTLVNFGLDNVLIIAGGGGGSSMYPGATGGDAGIIYPGDAANGGNPNPGTWGNNAGGGGKTTTKTPGTIGGRADSQLTNPTNGSIMQGGNGGVGARFNSDFGGGGGGGGAYAGAGGSAGGEASGGGGGGSSYSIGEIFYKGSNPAGIDGYVRIETLEPVEPEVFTYTGNLQTWRVPRFTESIRVVAVGAAGGNTNYTYANGYPQNLGGNGSIISAIVPVTTGNIMSIVVGGAPGISSTALYGYGGNGGLNSSIANRDGGAGGGLSGIFDGSPSYSNALVVAAGGGGSGSGWRPASLLPNEGGDGGVSPNGNGENGRDLNTNFGNNYGTGANIQSNTPGAAGTVFDTNTSPPTSGNALTGGNGGSINVTTWNGGGGGGAGILGGGGGAGGGDASGGGGGGASYSKSSNINLYQFTPQVTFYYTGEMQEYVVPAGVTQLTITAVGAAGGYRGVFVSSGAGANITSTVNVTPNSTLYVAVGGYPGNSHIPSPIGGGGFGGGSGNDSNVGFIQFGSAGGGYSGVFTASNPTLPSALIVAGGGGGASGEPYNGGNAGVNTGASGNGGIGVGGGGGATTSFGGSPGTVLIGKTAENTPPPTGGTQLQGGNAGGIISPRTINNGGGGGGGGYYGGGGGAAGVANRQGGGGGGSSWASNTITTGTLNTVAHGRITIQPVIPQGHGRLMIYRVT